MRSGWSASNESTKPSRSRPRSHACELTGAAPNAVGASRGGSSAPDAAASFNRSFDRATPLSLVRASRRQGPSGSSAPSRESGPASSPGLLRHHFRRRRRLLHTTTTRNFLKSPRATAGPRRPFGMNGSTPKLAEGLARPTVRRRARDDGPISQGVPHGGPRFCGLRYHTFRLGVGH